MPFPVRPAHRGRPRTHAIRDTATRTTKEDTTTQLNQQRPIRRRQHLARARWRRLRPALRWLLGAIALAAALTIALASPAVAATTTATSLSSLISNLTDWLVGLLAGVATLFLTLGGIRYLTAGGDPGQVEKAKTALKSAAVGYALAALAPLLVSILASLVA